MKLVAIINWFLQELLVLVYEELSGRTKPTATTDKSRVPVFKRGE